jgi:hypothetical protein
MLLIILDPIIIPKTLRSFSAFSIVVFTGVPWTYQSYSAFISCVYGSS